MAISMEFSSHLPWSFNPTPPPPPPSFNLFLSITNPRFLFVMNRVNKSQLLCHCSSLSSSDQQQQLLQEPVAEDDDDGGGLDGKYDDSKGQIGNLVKECKGQIGNLVKEYGWQVRKMVEKDDEMRSVANIQAQAFHQPLFLFNDVFFQFFEAEVLAGLLYRLRNSPPDRYACLVAETSISDEQEKQQLVGVVDVTVFRDESVLKHLSEANEYLYVSGIAVLHNFRRKKVASALLKACETLALLWGYKYLVLRAYEDDLGARKLYTNAGYKIVSGDPVWTTSWIGRKRRILMLKQCDMT